MCTVLLLPEDKDDEGHVLGDVMVTVDSSQSSPTEQWFALVLSPTSSQPRVIHPAPLVEVHLRLAYERAPRQLGSPSSCARPLRATSPGGEAENDAAGGSSGGALEPLEALEDKVALEARDATEASLTPRTTSASRAGTTPAHAAGMSVCVSRSRSLLSA